MPHDQQQVAPDDTTRGPLPSQLPTYPHAFEYQTLLKKQYNAQRLFDQNALMASGTPDGADIVDRVRARASEPGFFEKYIFGPLTYLGEATARGFTEGKLVRGGELLRSQGGIAGWETLGGAPSLEAAGEAKVGEVPVGKFSDEKSEGIIFKAIVDAWGIEDDPTPESFLQGVGGIITDPYSSKTIDRMVRTGASTAQFLSELVLDTITDPLAVFTMVKPVHLLARGGDRVFPTIRRFSRAERDKMIMAGEDIGVQLMGHGVIAEAARNTFKAGAKLTHKTMEKSLTILHGSGKAKELMERAGSTIDDIINSTAKQLRLFDKLAYFRTLSRRERLIYKKMMQANSAQKNLIPGYVDQQLTHSLKNVGLGTDTASVKKATFISEALDEGWLVPTTNITDLFLPNQGLKSKFFPAPEEHLDTFRVVDWQAALARRQESTYAKWIKESDLPGLMDDAWRVRYAMAEVGKEEMSRGLLRETLMNYVPRIFKSKYHYQKAVKENMHGRVPMTDDLGYGVIHDTFLPFAEHRKDKMITLRELNKAGFEPEMDIRKLLTMRLSNHRNNVIWQDYVQNMLTFGGREAMKVAPELIAQGFRIVNEFGGVMRQSKKISQKIRSLPETAAATNARGIFNIGPASVRAGKTALEKKEAVGFSTLLDLTKDTKTRDHILRHPALQAAKTIGLNPNEIAIPKVLYKEIARASNRSSRFRDFFNTTIVGQMIEAQTQIWRRGVTVINPAFYFTNVIGDIGRQFSELGVAALNPKRAIDTYRVLNGSTKQVRIGKLSQTGAEWLEEIRQAGIMGSFTNRIDAGSAAWHQGRILQAATRGREILGTPLRKAREAVVGEKQVGQVIEDWGRSTLYLNARAQGFNRAQAVDVVHNTLFDYFHGLTEFEREVMRRVVPFYSFLRFNAAFQAKQILHAPSRVIMPERAARVSEAGTDLPTYRDLLFPYEEALTTFGGTIDEEGRPQVIGLRLTAREFWSRIPKSLEGEDLRNAARQWFEVLHPSLKAGMNFITGQDPVYGGPPKEFLTNQAFGVMFHNAPRAVRELLGVHPYVTPMGERTWAMDTSAYFLITSMGLGRLLSSSGHLEKAGIDLRLAEAFHFGDGQKGVYDQWSPDELTKFQGVVSAFLGQPVIPFGELHMARRELRKVSRTQRDLKQKLRRARGAGQLLQSPITQD